MDVVRSLGRGALAGAAIGVCVDGMRNYLGDDKDLKVGATALGLMAGTTFAAINHYLGRQMMQGAVVGSVVCGALLGGTDLAIFDPKVAIFAAVTGGVVGMVAVRVFGEAKVCTL